MWEECDLRQGRCDETKTAKKILKNVSFFTMCNSDGNKHLASRDMLIIILKFDAHSFVHQGAIKQQI